MIQTATEPVSIDVPEGYELVRIGMPRKGDLVLEDIKHGTVVEWRSVDSHYVWPLVRKAWKAPEWVPAGSWVYYAGDGWYCSIDEPTLCHGDVYGARSVQFRFAPTADNWSAPKHTKKIQVKHS